jgi:23S rRNA (pseudouridine1915-N3)-methyltransferase
MMEIWWTGKTNPKYLLDGTEDYIGRIRKMNGLLVREFREAKGIKLPQQIIAFEETQILSQLEKSKVYSILLDEQGKRFNSLEFAKWLEPKLVLSVRPVCFMIGSPYGSSNQLKQKVDFTLSLSDMTFSHQLVRLVFLEQLYRCLKIIHNQPYHHE